MHIMCKIQTIHYHVISYEIGILAFGSPLVVVADVLKKKSNQGLDIILATMNTLCAGLWFAYGSNSNICILQSLHIYDAYLSLSFVLKKSNRVVVEEYIHIST